MLRITHTHSVTHSTIKLEGKLLGAWVDELRSVVLSAVRANDPVCLNLESLSFADAAGIALLRQLRRDRIPLIGASRLISGLLLLWDGPA